MECNVIGGGIAGTVLSFLLVLNGYSVNLYDNNISNSASMNASGMVNTLSTKFPTEIYQAAEIFSAFEKFIELLPNCLRTNWNPIGILHPFSSNFEFNNWSIEIANQMNMQKYVQLVSGTDSSISLPFGGFVARNRGWFNINNFINETLAYLKLNPKFHFFNEFFNKTQINTKDFYLFCEGSLNNSLKMKKVKGSYLWVEIPDFNLNHVLWKHYHLIPQEKSLFRFGSSFIYEDSNNYEIQNEIAILEKELYKLIPVPFKVIEIFQGVRSTTSNRKPILHQENQNIFYLNGLGSKGILNSIYYSLKILEKIKLVKF